MNTRFKLFQIFSLIMIGFVIAACGQEGVYFDEDTGEMSYETLEGLA